jgi:hypothetical protein
MYRPCTEALREIRRYQKGEGDSPGQDLKTDLRF